MKSRITQLIDKICAEKNDDVIHCDVHSSRFHKVTTQIPVNLYRQLETIASEYHQDLERLAGDFLTLALEEAIEHLPKEEKTHLDMARRQHEREVFDQIKERCAFDAGGT